MPLEQVNNRPADKSKELNISTQHLFIYNKQTQLLAYADDIGIVDRDQTIT
jgi:hypothetical protein